MKKIYFLAVLFLVFFTSEIFAQSEPSTLEIVGYTKQKGKAIKGSTVTVYDGASVVDTKSSLGGGRFVFHLEFGKKYKVTVAKDGFIEMFFEIDGTVSGDETLENMTTDLDIKMIKQPLDGTKKTYDKSVAKVFYQDELGEFDYDWDYDDQVTNELREVQKDIDTKDKLFKKQNKDKLEDLAKAEHDEAKAKETILYHEMTEGGHAGAADNKNRAKIKTIEYTFLRTKLCNAQP